MLMSKVVTWSMLDPLWCRNSRAELTGCQIQICASYEAVPTKLIKDRANGTLLRLWGTMGTSTRKNKMFKCSDSGPSVQCNINLEGAASKIAMSLFLQVASKCPQGKHTVSALAWHVAYPKDKQTLQELLWMDEIHFAPLGNHGKPLLLFAGESGGAHSWDGMYCVPLER